MSEMHDFLQPLLKEKLGGSCTSLTKYPFQLWSQADHLESGTSI